MLSQECIQSLLSDGLLETANALKAQFIVSDGQDNEAAKIVYGKYRLRDLVPALKHTLGASTVQDELKRRRGSSRPRSTYE
jgi:hypothetical protein